MAEGNLNVRVVSPEKMVFEGEASAVVAPAWDGQVGILPNHAPMLTLVGSGVMNIDRPGGGSDSFHLHIVVQRVWPGLARRPRG